MFEIGIAENVTKLILYSEPCTVIRQVLLESVELGGYSRFTPLTLYGGPFVTCLCRPLTLITPTIKTLKYDDFSLQVNEKDFYAYIASCNIDNALCIIIHQNMVPTLQLIMKANLLTDQTKLLKLPVPKLLKDEIFLSDDQEKILRYESTKNANDCFMLNQQAHQLGLSKKPFTS